jgi:two-component system, LytTR family, response regulator
VRVVIADDEPLGRLALRQLAAPHRDLDIAGEARDGREAIELVHRLAPDVLLLDVQMPELDGFDVLAALAPAIPATIFVTAHDSFAVKAFEAHALDYVIKPVGQARFDAAVARVRDAIAKDRAAELGRRLDELLAERGVERIVARLGDRSTVIAVADIDWIEAQDYCAAVHVGNTTHVVRQTLAVLESRLDARRFVRIHRSALVNVTRIRELLHDAGELVAVLASGERLPVSRRRRDALERALGMAG